MGSCLSLHKPQDLELEIKPEQAGAGHSPISLLSDGILYLVLIHVADAEPIYDILGFASEQSMNSTYYSCLGWTRLSAVCRRWRAIVIGAASLWAEDVFGFPAEMAALALIRSGTAPLSMLIPPYKTIGPDLLRQVQSKKKWGLLWTHRERLLNLAVTHSDRIKQFMSSDLSSEHYHMIFKNGHFDSLTTLVLEYAYDDAGPSAPSREDLDDLRIVAPNVRAAGLSPTLPIAYDDKPGLHIVLPALRKLIITGHVDSRYPTTYPTFPTSVEQLRWIPSLICGAPMLEHLAIEMPIFQFVVDWVQIFNGKRSNLPALRICDIFGMPETHLEQLFDLIAPDIPAETVIRVLLSEEISALENTDLPKTIQTYGSIIGRSIRLHSLDTVYLSQQLSRATFPRTPSISAASVVLLVFPGIELPLLKRSMDDYLDRCSSQTARASLLATSASIRPERNVDPSDVSNDILKMIAPILTNNEIKTLILDENPTVKWANTMREVMRTSLPNVTTLYCVNASECTYARNSLSSYPPCTTALRLLYDTNKKEVHGQLPEGPSELSHSADLPETQQALLFGSGGVILPALETVVVSMNVAPVAEGCSALRRAADVRAWWDELICALTRRHDLGLRVRVLRIVGGWTTGKLRKRTAKMDTKMLARAGMLVDEVTDERTVSSQVE